MNITSVYAECIDLAMAEGRFEIEGLVAMAFRRHPDLLAEHGAHLAQLQMRNGFKRLLADPPAAKEQLSLPGFHLPAAIAVRREDGVVEYVNSERATWVDLEAGLAERERHVAAAQDKVEAFRLSMDMVRPYMAAYPDVTVGDALRRAAAA